ncbi:hypothetical protein N7530_008960 [Penicillium desertorum]|uniref:Uncharacterized protein n=1 Tax=Penicillium desertorum TaxID=1303715 RepID=A0A9W9WQQ9_9EURO|nr:hypothetical protein N7530_008960 [Penicillium desertorum]
MLDWERGDPPRTPSVISPEPRCTPWGIPFFYPSSFRIGIQPSKPSIFLVKVSPATMYESESGRDRPFQPAPPCYMGLSSCYWLSYIQHGVSHDVLTPQLEEYPS